MSMLCYFLVRRTDKHPAGHSQMYDPLPRLFPIAGGFWLKNKHDMLPHAAHLGDARGGECVGDLFSFRLQRLRMLAKPDRVDHISSNAPIQSSGNGFDFRKLRHRESVKDRVI